MRDGDLVGPYRVLRPLGQGGMGAVYLAEHTLIGRRAAIKVLLPELSASRDNVDRFFNEARATTAVSDPGIVQVFDFGFAPDHSAYIVMELLEGEPLDARLERLVALPQEDALWIVRQAASSLAAAHGAGIVHRDLKPENLYMIRDASAPNGERPKILDFGIAKLGDHVPDRIKTRTGAVMGTPVYMSPEQCSGAGAVDHRADIYALGCVLFHMLTGRPPFAMLGLGEVISAHLREPAPAPSSLQPGIVPALDDLVLCCLAKSPAQRYQTMAELQAACDAVLAQLSPGSSQALSLRASGAPVSTTPSRGPAGTWRLDSSAPAWPGSHTTLGASAGQPVASAPRRRRIGLWAGLLGLAACAGVATVLIASGGSKPAANAPPPAPAPAAAGQVPPADPVPAPAAPPPAEPAQAGSANAPALASDPAATAPADPAAATSSPSPPPATARPGGKGTGGPGTGGPARPRAPKPPGRPGNHDKGSQDLYDDR